MSDQVLARVSDEGILLFWCDGCKEIHGVWVYPSKNPKTDAQWKWNNDMTKPTFTPSILVHGFRMPDGSIGQPICHSYITAGRIQYLGDCEHALAGQTVDLRADPLEVRRQ